MPCSILPLLVVIFGLSDGGRKINENANPYCFDILETYRDSIKNDVLGDSGIRLYVTNELIKNDCTFINRYIYSVKYFYGEPNEVIIWNESFATPKMAVTYKYRLSTKNKDIKLSRGDKILNIICSKDQIIQRFFIHTVDE